MSINYTLCSQCSLGWVKPPFKECYNCYKKNNQIIAVVYDLGGDKDQYFETHPGNMKRSQLPSNVSPTEDNEVYASQLK